MFSLNFVCGRFALLLPLFLINCGPDNSGDRDFETSVVTPANVGEHPRVAYDEGHHNRHTARGTYRLFVELIWHDGYDVETRRDGFTAANLASFQVLVVVGAKSEGDASASPAFMETECTAIVAYVTSGGSLLLITDHFPFGSAVEALGRHLGVEVSKGLTIDPVAHDHDSNDDSQLVFSHDNGRVGSHPITWQRSSRHNATVAGGSASTCRATIIGSSLLTSPDHVESSAHEMAADLGFRV